jgi:hypothetical protein
MNAAPDAYRTPTATPDPHSNTKGHSNPRRASKKRGYEEPRIARGTTNPVGYRPPTDPRLPPKSHESIAAVDDTDGRSCEPGDDDPPAVEGSAGRPRTRKEPLPTT